MTSYISGVQMQEYLAWGLHVRGLVMRTNISNRPNLIFTKVDEPTTEALLLQLAKRQGDSMKPI